MRRFPRRQGDVPNSPSDIWATQGRVSVSWDLAFWLGDFVRKHGDSEDTERLAGLLGDFGMDAQLIQSAHCARRGQTLPA